MVQVKDVEKSSPELQALIESEIKQLLKVGNAFFLVMNVSLETQWQKIGLTLSLLRVG